MSPGRGDTLGTAVGMAWLSMGSQVLLSEVTSSDREEQPERLERGDVFLDDGAASDSMELQVKVSVEQYVDTLRWTNHYRL